MTRNAGRWHREQAEAASPPWHTRGDLDRVLVAMAVLVIVMLAITAAMGTMQNLWVRVRGKADASATPHRPGHDGAAGEPGDAELALGAEHGPRDPGAGATAAGLGPAFRLRPGRHAPDRTAVASMGHALFFRGRMVSPRRAASSRPGWTMTSSAMRCAAGVTFVEFGSDASERPSFLNSVQDRFPPRRRFRLWEFRAARAGVESVRARTSRCC